MTKLEEKKTKDISDLGAPKSAKELESLLDAIYNMAKKRKLENKVSLNLSANQCTFGLSERRELINNLQTTKRRGAKSCTFSRSCKWKATSYVNINTIYPMGFAV